MNVALAVAATVLFCLSLSGAAAAQDKPEPDNIWLARPTQGELRTARAAAVTAGVFARAVARCDVAADGWLTACRVVDPGPPGLGMGDALLDLGPKYRLTPEAARASKSRVLVLSHDLKDEDARWIRRPTVRMFTAVFPVEAYKKGISGRAVISCVLTEASDLTQCIVAEETPEDSGFGAAAIAMVPQLRLAAAKANGRPVRSTVTIPLGFDMHGTSGAIRETRRRVIPASLTWAEAPDFAAVAAVMPAGVKGRAILLCDLMETGRLSRCDVTQVEPKGQGIEAASQTLAGQFMLPLSEAERKAAASLRIQLPITFDAARIDASRPIVEKPLWAKSADAATLTAAFGPLGLKAPVRAVVSCQVQAGGHLTGCRTSESDGDAAVAAAAVAVAETQRLSTWSNEGLPVVGGQVSVPVRYDPPK